jgi:hypothetical protein
MKTLIVMLGVALCMIGTIGLAEGASVARLLDSGDGLELSFQEGGQSVTEVIPVYREEGSRYFSAGIGIDERQAEYPPFPLKLVFTAGGKPFLTGVAVTIRSAKDGKVLTIPDSRITGPWLFIDLAPGLYHIAGTYGGQAQSLNGIKVEAGKQKTIHLRWPEDRGAGNLLPAN